MTTEKDFKEAVMAAAQEQIEQAIKIYADVDELSETQSDYAADLASRIDTDALLESAMDYLDDLEARKTRAIEKIATIAESVTCKLRPQFKGDTGQTNLCIYMTPND